MFRKVFFLIICEFCVDFYFILYSGWLIFDCLDIILNKVLEILEKKRY